jgi:hypothetical protein
MVHVPDSTFVFTTFHCTLSPPYRESAVQPRLGTAAPAALWAMWGARQQPALGRHSEDSSCRVTPDHLSRPVPVFHLISLWRVLTRRSARQLLLQILHQRASASAPIQRSFLEAIHWRFTSSASLGRAATPDLSPRIANDFELGNRGKRTRTASETPTGFHLPLLAPPSHSGTVPVRGVPPSCMQ